MQYTIVLEMAAKSCYVNASKTNQVVFGTRHRLKKANAVRLSVNNVKLQVVPTYRYLGFMLDSPLLLNHHVKTAANIVT